MDLLLQWYRWCLLWHGRRRWGCLLWYRLGLVRWSRDAHWWGGRCLICRCLGRCGHSARLHWERLGWLAEYRRWIRAALDFRVNRYQLYHIEI